MLNRLSLHCLSVLVSLAIVGCKQQAPQESPPAENAAEVPSAPPPGEVSMDTEDTNVEAELTFLTAAEKAAVEAQGICPVSEDELGSMGAPIKVNVDGRDVYICCESCREPLLANPAKYLAVLDSRSSDADTAGGDN